MAERKKSGSESEKALRSWVRPGSVGLRMGFLAVPGAWRNWNCRGIRLAHVDDVVGREEVR